jgi:hypothetical protein
VTYSFSMANSSRPFLKELGCANRRVMRSQRREVLKGSMSAIPAAAVLLLSMAATAQVRSTPLPAPMSNMPVRFQPPTGQGYYLPRAAQPYIGAMDTYAEMPSPALPYPKKAQVAPPPTIDGWTNAAKEGDKVVAPAGATVRFGTGKTWSAPITLSKETTFTVDSGFFGGDPAYGKPKLLAVKGSAEGIIVNGVSVMHPDAKPEQPGRHGAATQPAAASGYPKTVQAATVQRPTIVIPPAVWMQIGGEGDVLSVPANVTLRYGNDSGWSRQMVLTKPTTFTVSSTFFGGTPAANSTNVVEVLGTLSVQPEKTGSAPVRK